MPDMPYEEMMSRLQKQSRRLRRCVDDLGRDGQPHELELDAAAIEQAIKLLEEMHRD